MNDNIHDRTNYSYMNKLYYCPINNMWFYPYMMNPYMCSYTRNMPSYDCMENCMENNYRFAEENTINKQYNNNKEEIEHIEGTDEYNIKQNKEEYKLEDNMEDKNGFLNNRHEELDDIITINNQREPIIIEEDDDENREKYKERETIEEDKEGYIKKENKEQYIEKQEIKDRNRNSNFLQNKNRQSEKIEESENINLTNNIANIKMRKVPLKEITD